MRFLCLTLILSARTILPAAGPAIQCDALAAKSFGDDVKISSATLVPAKGNLPEHCDVRGVIWPEARFAIKLPTEWNERFQMLGNGGTAGTISLGPVDNAVRKGFAASSTDTGHDAAKEPLATFAYVTPENPNGHRKLIDFAYLSVHETAALSKRVIAAYYSAAPKYSYWVGCSTGGRPGLHEAQRYPEDFDGLVIGAPGVSLTGNVTRRLWIGQSQAGDGAIPAAKLPLLTKAIYEKCDALDGLKDGLIDDPRACPFDPARDVAKCAAGDGPDCFTAAQIDALKKIYGGPRDSKGRQIFFGELVGSEPVWPDNFIPPSKTVLPRSESQMKLAMLNPPPGPSWTYTMFNFDTDPPKVAEAAAILNPQNPDLAPSEKARRENCAVRGLGRSTGESATWNRVLQHRQQAPGRNRNARLLPAVHGAGHVPLQRRPRLRVGRLAFGCYGMGGKGHGTRADCGRASGERRRHAHAAAVPVSAGGAI